MEKRFLTRSACSLHTIPTELSQQLTRNAYIYTFCESIPDSVYPFHWLRCLEYAHLGAISFLQDAKPSKLFQSYIFLHARKNQKLMIIIKYYTVKYYET
jgi:hypothetical protein